MNRRFMCRSQDGIGRECGGGIAGANPDRVGHRVDQVPISIHGVTVTPKPVPII